MVLAIFVGIAAPAGFAQDDEDTDPQATISALQTQVAELAGAEATAAPEESASTVTPDDGTESAEGVREETETGSAGTINVELIFDVSGSMAQGLETGETRMDAAKRVLGGVIAAIPQREGVNVGLRIYGHEGDNTEAGQAVSCESSELVVPVEGVEAAELGEQIAALQPTGWTPIALSLERAAEDFPEASEDVTNAIVLVTDGLETCGGDPAAVAGVLRDGDAAITTHVIGFALTGEEQQLLAGIAEQGGGQLLGATNAEELSAALFSVLEELEIVAGAGFVGGNAFSLVPAGESGELSVVAVGIPGSMFGGLLPFVVRNNTSEDVAAFNVSGTARDAGGGLIAAGDALYLQPHFLRSGGVALGGLYLGGEIELPPDVVWEFEVEPLAAGSFEADYYRDLDVVEASLFEDRIVGTLENSHNEPVAGPLFLLAVCFDLDSNVVGVNQDTADTAAIDPSETQSLQVDLFSSTLSGLGCPAFLVAGSGTTT